MPKTNKKTQIRQIISRVDFLDTKQKSEWESMLAYMDDDQINETYKFFKKAIKDEENVMFKVLIKNGLQKKYQMEVEKISKQTMKSAKNKEKKQIWFSKKPNK